MADCLCALLAARITLRWPGIQQMTRQDWSRAASTLRAALLNSVGRSLLSNRRSSPLPWGAPATIPVFTCFCCGLVLFYLFFFPLFVFHFSFLLFSSSSLFFLVFCSLSLSLTHSRTPSINLGFSSFISLLRSLFCTFIISLSLSISCFHWSLLLFFPWSFVCSFCHYIILRYCCALF